ncbi:MAG: hypothetical protein C0612_02560 [Desulfobulbaceae bacterium]|nr:MAG: hypothetical protein C0612_02560 [Desulfobulbaceae bacterium]
MACPLRAEFGHKTFQARTSGSTSFNCLSFILFQTKNSKSPAVKVQNKAKCEPCQYFYLIVYHFVLLFASFTNQNMFNDITFDFFIGSWRLEKMIKPEIYICYLRKQ